MFLKKQKKQPGPAAEPLEAIPLLPDGITCLESGDGMVVTRSTMPACGIRRHLARLVTGRCTVQVELDRQGVFFWRQIDGKRKLADIARALRREFGFSEKDAGRATVEFTKMLMKKHLVWLKIEKDGVKAAACTEAGSA